MLVQNTIEENGLTVEQNNKKIPHKIPVGSLVEIVYNDEYDENNTFGVRLFVVAHTRDCDGTPLYSLSFNKTAWDEMNKAETALAEEKKNPSGNHYTYSIISMSLNLTKGSITGGYSEDCIKIV